MDSHLVNDAHLYTVLVAGDVDLKQYHSTQAVDPYVAYRYADRGKIRERTLDMYKQLIDVYTQQNKDSLVFLLQTKVEDIEDMTDEEFFDEITKGMTYDKTTGDALSTINPNGMYTTLREPTLATAIPLGDDLFTCKVSEIITKEMPEGYIRIASDYWDSVNDTQKELLIATYGDKETYIRVTKEPLCYNAFVSTETGWVEQSNEDQINWILNFRERFIKPLPDDTKLRVYNFTK